MNFNADYGELLVVEDNLEIWTVLQYIFPRTLPGVKVHHCIDGPSALAYLQARLTYEQMPPPQLILQDLYMPLRTDGLALLRSLKQTGSPFSQLPVVVMSSSHNNEDIQEAYRLGASAYLQKPLSIDEWAKSILGLRRFWYSSNDRVLG